MRHYVTIAAGCFLLSVAIASEFESTKDFPQCRTPNSELDNDEWTQIGWEEGYGYPLENNETLHNNDPQAVRMDEMYNDAGIHYILSKDLLDYNVQSHVAESIINGPFDLNSVLTEFGERDFHRLMALGLKSFVGEITTTHFRRLYWMLPDLELVASQSQDQLISILETKLDFLGDLGYSLLLELHVSRTKMSLLKFLCMECAIDKTTRQEAIEKYLEAALALASGANSCFINEYEQIFSVHPSINVIKRFYNFVAAENKPRLMLDLMNFPFEETDDSLIMMLQHSQYFSGYSNSKPLSFFLLSPVKLSADPEQCLSIKARNDRFFKFFYDSELYSFANDLKFGTRADIEEHKIETIRTALDFNRNFAMFAGTCSTIWDRMAQDKDMESFWTDFAAELHDNHQIAAAKFITKPWYYWNIFGTDRLFFIRTISGSVLHLRNISTTSFGDKFMNGLKYCVEKLGWRSKSMYLDYYEISICHLSFNRHFNGADWQLIEIIRRIVPNVPNPGMASGRLECMRKCTIWFGYAGTVFVQNVGKYIYTMSDDFCEILNRIIFHALLTDQKSIFDLIKHDPCRIDMMAVALAKGAIPVFFMRRFFHVLYDLPTLSPEELDCSLKSLMAKTQDLCKPEQIPYGLTVEMLTGMLTSKL